MQPARDSADAFLYRSPATSLAQGRVCSSLELTGLPPAFGSLHSAFNDGISHSFLPPERSAFALSNLPCDRFEWPRRQSIGV